MGADPRPEYWAFAPETPDDAVVSDAALLRTAIRQYLLDHQEKFPGSSGGNEHIHVADSLYPYLSSCGFINEHNGKVSEGIDATGYVHIKVCDWMWGLSFSEVRMQPTRAIAMIDDGRGQVYYIRARDLYRLQ